MKISTNVAFALAGEIEWINAQARVADRPRRRGDPEPKMLALYEYDALAATCLAELILTRVNGAQQ